MKGRIIMNTAPQTATAPIADRDDRSSDELEIVVVDQGTGQEHARRPVSTRAEVEAAVATARGAAESWWQAGFSGRARMLQAWQREIAEHAEEGVELIHLENGKPLEDARTEILAVLGHLQFVIANAERVLGRRDVAPPPASPNQQYWVEHLPYGVVAVIGPWNFPLMTPGALVIHAMAAGNSVVFKPSQITSMVGEWLVETWKRAAPEFADVLECVVGFAQTGRDLIDVGVDKVAFTGSVRSGKAVAAQCATTLTPTLLELGGNDGVIIAEDADLDEAAQHVAWGSMQNAGLGCISLEVAYVVDSVHDAFLEKLVDVTERIRVGSDEEATIGPVPLPTQIPNIQHHVADAIAHGATVALGGTETVTDGRYLQPTILDNVPADALTATEETFGPTLAIVTVSDVDEAVDRINRGSYGLGSAVFSKSHGAEIASRLRVGMTSVNDALVVSMNPGMPFGGRGDSGHGRKHGEEGLREFAYPHSISVKKAPSAVSMTSFARPQGAVTAALNALRQRILEAPNL